jgi:hypothetical protein
MGLLKSKDGYDIVTFNGLTATTGIAGTVVNVKTSQAELYGYHLHNNAAAVTWVQLFFKAAADVTLGTTIPDVTIKLESNESVRFFTEYPIRAIPALSVAATTGEVNNTGAGTALTGSFFLAKDLN